MKWFRRRGEAHLQAARRLRTAFEKGELIVLAPTIIHLELINVAGRRWGWKEDRLAAMARSLGRLGLQLIDPELERVASWTARGLTAYDAAYVAVAETAGLPLVTGDAMIVSTAPGIAHALSTV